VRALDDISFTLNAGEIHCICGENGAGKSTLIKIISGAYQPDDGGEFLFEGKAVTLSPQSAMELGIQTIYQEHTIFGPLSVTENIFVGMEITKKGFMQYAEMQRRTQEVLDYLDSGIDPEELAENLSSGEQKIIEFAKALVFDRKIIILDEPTASFSITEIDNLLGIVAKIKERGIGIIYISHHLDEVERIADRITILRDGKHIGTTSAAEITGPELIRQMVGRDATAFYNREHFPPGDMALEVTGLTGNGVNDCTFYVRRGEVLGFAGMVGSGRSELMTLLFGGAEKLAGSVKIFGEEVDVRSPRRAIRHKMCYITEDRQHTGLFLIHTIARNTIIANLLISSGAFYMPEKEEQIGQEYLEKLGTKAENADVLVGNLSGGNQQKVVLAKWFNTVGEIFIFDEPTRGIDVGAKQEIYQLMTNLLRDNKAIIMVSSDMPEVISMSDRIMVMKDGHIVGEVSGDDVTEENVLEYSIGGKKI
jgi:ribose transport system ATP-binding protein